MTAAESSKRTVLVVGIAAGAHVARVRLAALARLAARLAPCAHERRAVGQQGEAEDGVDDAEGAVLGRRAEDPVQALVEREAGARDEDPDGRQEGPEEALLAVAEGVLGVGRALPQRQREEQEDLVHRVGDRVGRLGQHGRRARGEAGHELGHRDRRVGRQRDEHGAARGARPAAVGHQREPLRAAVASATSAAMRRLLLVGLGMPLDAEREAAIGGLEGLGQFVDGRPAGDLEALADALDALVMVGLGARG